ncbi:MAG: DUF5107 domain-containing protein [Chitinophagaceae bacterium]|nr:MAG: DUF5107 domain-containing protein [Chitinophagaceae bacterium]
MSQVTAWVEKVKIPTYGIGAPEKNPIFLEKRVYQGSKGVVYPHPVVEKILDEKSDKEYTAVFIENEYLKIMVLPELGGRVQRAYDKIRQRDFIYYNQVIKPALVGLTGPWISGGIEFNWPQHHRPSTFSPIDFTIQEYEDGSKTIWVNEVEIMTRTKGMTGFTLYPGKAYLEVKGRIFNRTPFAQSFLWWANPAVKVNDHYQSVFPPDVHAVFDHGKRDVSDFPIATGVYYKVDYSPGTDISRYKNIPVPTSYMAVQSNYNFVGCYEHDTHAGMLHVANHHVSPGKKQWTWGNGDFGRAWDRNLTDEDGPYIELMCGVYTDNQPDFSWIQANEEKTFEQYFLPYQGIGVVKNATRDAAINLALEDGNIRVQLYVTGIFTSSQLRITHNGEDLLVENVDLTPHHFHEANVSLKGAIKKDQLEVTLFDQHGKVLVSYRPENNEHQEMPPPAVAALQPSEIESNELLFLNGLHLEQYRHATYLPTDYYLEALKRDAGDIRCNNAMGVWLMRRAKFHSAEPYLRAAVKRLTLRNPNPYDGEPYYNLGFCLMQQGKDEEAIAAFYKSTWNDAWQHSAFLQLACLFSKKGEYQEALQLVDNSLLKNQNSHTARHLKVGLLRKTGLYDYAEREIHSALQVDPFNYGCRFESYLILQSKGDSKASEVLYELKKLMRHEFNNYSEYFFDYWHAGLYAEAEKLMAEFVNDSDLSTINPLVYYYLGALHVKLDSKDNALEYFRKAADAKPDYCFPGKIEDVTILKTAIEFNPSDARAFYYLGNFWYANGQFDDAIKCWEASIALDKQFATVHRNISLAYYNKRSEVNKAMTALKTAFELDDTDARVLMELDQLYKLQNVSHHERLHLLEKYDSLVSLRDDLYLERIVLYNQLGQYEKAMQLLSQRKFHPWEGGEGKTVGQFLISHTELAKKAIIEQQFSTALELLAATEKYPDNLGEGKLPGAQENDIHFLRGLAYEGLGNDARAKEEYQRATEGISEPLPAIFYNDPQPDKIIYQGLAWTKLGNHQMAKDIFNRLVEFSDEHMNDEVKIDYFAVSLPDLQVFDQDLNMKNRIHCLYVAGLGWLGLREYDKSETFFNRVLQQDVNHQGAIIHRKMRDLVEAILVYQ